jgi:hypothetical protein
MVSMIRSLAVALALSLAGPVLGQEAVEPPPAASASGALDLVTAWEADPGAVLPAEGVALGDFEYVARPLVIFGESPRQPEVLEQLRLIEAELGTLADRDVAVILDTDPDARSDVRAALRPRGFALVLLDKDGRVTLRRPAPLSVREIARAIDRSPLRLEELRNGRTTPPTN